MAARYTPFERFVLSFVIASFPTPFRLRFRHVIEETFHDRLVHARRERHRLRFLASFLLDGLTAGVRERFHSTLREPTRERFHMGKNTMRMLEAVVLDLRLAWRTLRRRPVFTATAVATLAIGFGANTAIFSVINGVLLQPLDYHEPERLVRIDVAPDGPHERPGTMSYPDINDILQQAPSLETLVGINSSRATLTGLGEPRVLEVQRLTDGLLETFQEAPLLGRDVRAEEFGEFSSATAVVVLSHALWMTQFGGDPDVVGRTISLDQVSYEIVGVAPANFAYPNNVDLWVPRFLNIEGCGRGCHTMRTIGRLAPGVSVETLQAELNQIALRLEQEYPATNTGKRFLVRSLLDFMVSDVKQGLVILMLAVTIVLMIACANVANLFLASAVAREGEIALRVALGAGRRRLMSQVFAESLVVAVFGGAAGLVIALVSVFSFRSLAADTIPRIDGIAVDGAVLLWTCGAVLIVTFLFGLVPAFSVSRAGPGSGLSQRSHRVGTDRGAARFRSALLVAQVGACTILLIGAGLLLRTFSQLHRVDLGYETSNVLRFRVGLPETNYPNLSAVRGFYRNLEERIAALPRVESVASVFGPPLGSGRASGTVLVVGRPVPGPTEETEAAIHAVSPDYFATMRISLLRGRGLEPADDVGGEFVAIVNQAFERENFPNEDAIGQRVQVTVDFGYGNPTWRIVGVAPDIRSDELEATSPAMIYVPHGRYGPEDMYVVVRATADAGGLLPSIRSELRSLDANIPLYSVELFDDALRRELAPTRLYLSLVAAFAVVAALLAAVGLYGVVSYVVSSRTREIGVRMALGARRAHVLRQVVARGLQPVAVGLVLGIVSAAATGRILEGVLYGVEPRDITTFATATLLLTIVALASVSIPAVRASRLDPARTLREE